MIILVTPESHGYKAAPFSPFTSALMQHDEVSAEVHFDSLDTLAAQLGNEMQDRQFSMLELGLDACIVVSEDRYNELMEN